MDMRLDCHHTCIYITELVWCKSMDMRQERRSLARLYSTTKMSQINGYEAIVQSQMHINHWNCVLQINGYEAGVQITRQALLNNWNVKINRYEAGVQSQMHINHLKCVLQIDGYEAWGQTITAHPQDARWLRGRGANLTPQHLQTITAQHKDARWLRSRGANLTPQHLQTATAHHQDTRLLRGRGANLKLQHRFEPSPRRQHPQRVVSQSPPLKGGWGVENPKP